MPTTFRHPPDAAGTGRGPGFVRRLEDVGLGLMLAFLAAPAALVAQEKGVGPGTAPAATTAPAPGDTMSPAALEAAARRVMQAAGYAAFITVDGNGHPQSRTVQPAAPDARMTVRFATNPHTRKVTEIGHNPRATLYYFDPVSLAYVSLAGRARVIRARAEKDRFWLKEWDAFYPDRDSSAVLIEVVPSTVEIVDIKRKVTGDKRTWRPPLVRYPR